MRSFFGAALIGCGILIAALSGLCTLVFLGASMGSSGGGEAIAMLPLALGLGGVPFVIGVGLLWLGRRLIRKADREAQEAVQSDVFD